MQDLYVLQELKNLENDKLEKADVVNNLTTSTTGKALDASQGKTLNDKIDLKADADKVLFYDQGEVVAPVEIDADTLSGRSADYFGSKSYVDTQDTNLQNQITVLSTDKADKNNTQLTGTATLNGKQLATMERVEIPFPFNSGYVQMSASYPCVILKNSVNKATAYFSVKKTDGSKFIANTWINIGGLPAGFQQKYGFQTVIGLPTILDTTPITLTPVCVYVVGNNVNIRVPVDCDGIVGKFEYDIV